jgi:hypothetical protein
MYVDDLHLLSASVSTLQSMINVCADEISYLDMHFNVSKSAVRRYTFLVNISIRFLSLHVMLFLTFHELFLYACNLNCEINKIKIQTTVFVIYL